MNLDRVNQIAKAVLYEGYMLYPYRPSSVKNRQRWNFGVLYPRSYTEIQDGSDAFSFRSECLVSGDVRALLNLKLRFLQLQVRSTESLDATAVAPDWQEAVEREVSLPPFCLETLTFGPISHIFEFPSQISPVPDLEPGGDSANRTTRRQEEISGEITVTIRRIHMRLSRLRIDVTNTTRFGVNVANRNEALLRSLVSTHLVMGVQGGDFVSLLEPPDDLKTEAAECTNVGVWPVLVGNSGERDTLLACPIILYDYPQIAPESAGDLFDGTEIDEILSLRIMTLTDEEKREVCQSDERARQILERTDSMPAEEFLKLHGAVRGLRSLKEGTP